MSIYTKLPKSALKEEKSNIKLVEGSYEDLNDFYSEGTDTASLEDKSIIQEIEDTISGMEEGKLIKGKILKITDSDVFVDIHFKSEGIIPVSEFKFKEDLVVGAEIDLFLEEMENEDGQIVLSKLKADFIKVWDRINDIHEQNELVKGKLVRKIKGGIVVDLFGIDAFLPGSQIDLRQIPDLDGLIGKTFDLKVIKVNKIRRNIVVWFNKY